MHGQRLVRSCVVSTAIPRQRRRVTECDSKASFPTAPGSAAQLLAHCGVPASQGGMVAHFNRPPPNCVQQSGRTFAAAVGLPLLGGWRGARAGSPPADPFYRRGCASVPRGRVLIWAWLLPSAARFASRRLAEKLFPDPSKAVIAQLAARRSHNPMVVSSILTRRTFFPICPSDPAQLTRPGLRARTNKTLLLVWQAAFPCTPGRNKVSIEQWTFQQDCRGLLITYLTAGVSRAGART